MLRGIVAETDLQNEPTDVDELTHLELRSMHQSASMAILFAKFIQWIALGFAITLLNVATLLVYIGPLDSSQKKVVMAACILITCGTVFILFMYQMWQVNEIKRVRKIEKHFSSLARRLKNIESRSDRNIERYTILIFMVFSLIASAGIAILLIR
jgi:hypothetical protein